MVTYPDYGDVGFPAYEESGTFGSKELFSGPTPLPVTEDFPVAANVVLAAFSVVGLDGSGLVVLAQQDGDPQAIGITTGPTITGMGATSVAIYRAGNFNPAALTWHASYTTDAHKKAAFNDAPTPTNIVIRKRL
jgi:hypothetical protein